MGPAGAAARGPWWSGAPVCAAWAASRTLVLLAVLGATPLDTVFVTADVKVIYQGWVPVLLTGTFPLDDVTWQYPPLTAGVLLLPHWLPWGYFTNFLVLTGICDALVLALLLRASRRDSSRTGAWLWTLAAPLLGPTLYCRYDVVVTAVAVAALLLLPARPRPGGILAGAGAMLKVWPALLLLGTPRGRRTRDAWTATALAAAAIGTCYATTTVGAFSFLKFQKNRGVEVESLGALPFYLAHEFGWGGRAEMHYGSTEFLGTGVAAVGTVMELLSLAALGWLLLWRLRARTWTAATPFDAALAAVLLFTVTSRVISPQYLVWLLGLAAVCLTRRETTQRTPAWLIAAATPLTFVEFPLRIGDLSHFQPLGEICVTVRNLLLLAAALLSCRNLWRSAVRVG